MKMKKETKRSQVCVVVTKGDYEKLRAKADEKRMTLAGYARWLIFEASGVLKDGE